MTLSSQSSQSYERSAKISTEIYRPSVCVDQFCSVEWEEVCVQQGDSEETTSSAVDACISAVQEQEEQSLQSEATTLTEYVDYVS